MGISATSITGQLNPIPDCFIRVQNQYIFMYSLPTISDGKDASYATEDGMGRTMPYKTFNSGGTRSISWKCQLISYDADSISRNIKTLRLLEACVYPRKDPSNIIPYIPPVVLSIRCGDLLASSGIEVNVVLTRYNTSFPTDQVWYTDYAFAKYFPTKLEVDLSFEVVYDARYLPGADRIFSLGA
jgi:hypothetical protein